VTDGEDVGVAAAKELKERLALLLISVPRLGLNYTEAQDAADWVIVRAVRVGWTLTIEGDTNA